MGDEVELDRAGDAGDDGERRAAHDAVLVHALDVGGEQAGGAGGGSVETGLVVGDVGGGEAGVGDGLLQGAGSVEHVGAHAAQELAFESVAGGQGPFLGVVGGGVEAFDRAGDFDRDAGGGEGGVGLDAVTQFAQVALHGGGVVADASDEA